MREWDELRFLFLTGRIERLLDSEWGLDPVRAMWAAGGTHFNFRQCGTHFFQDGRKYTVPVRQLRAQACKAGIEQ